MELNNVFDIITSQQFFDKLKTEHASVNQDLKSARHAINAASNAWHLSEWIYKKDIENTSLDKFRNKSSIYPKDVFRAACIKQCHQLETMGYICEGSKHLGTRRKGIVGSSLHRGAFSDAFSRGFDISCLVVTKDNGSEVDFISELESVIEFWEGYFSGKEAFMARLSGTILKKTNPLRLT